MSKYILTIDAGTTSERAIIFDKSGHMVGVSQIEFQQFFPKPGWVEHDAEEIWTIQKKTITDVLEKYEIKPSDIEAIGITNQRETTIVWNRKTGKPIYKAIVWQDRRTADFCEKLKLKGLESLIQQKTGLLIDAYFSASKIKWLLDYVAGARELAETGNLAFGTVDCWLLWNLTQGQVHATDVSNASRTMLYNINDMQWDKELLTLFEIPKIMLPKVKPSSHNYGLVDKGHFGHPIPISGIAGDQQSALFGQMCIESGMAKSTYGTGCFLIMNTGPNIISSKNKLLSTIAWQIGNDVTYALEGSIFIGGALIQWLRDNLKIIKSAGEIEALAKTVTDSAGVIFVPGFVGLGAPHWDPYGTGALIGINRSTSQGHIARAALEAIALQNLDILDTMEKDSDIKIKELRVDGGATANNLLLQIQSNIAKIDIIRPKINETTAQGVAFLAGLATGYWKNLNEIKKIWESDKVFNPQLDKNMDIIRKNWSKAIERSKKWFSE
jgi:glycerol kinase